MSTRVAKLIMLAIVVSMVLMGLLAALPAAAAPTAASCTSRGPNWEAYRVRPRDTLSHVARLYGVSQADLATWNNIRNRNLIYFGTYLCVDLSASSVRPNPVTGAGAPCSTGSLRLRYGDTLSGVAFAFGNSISGIAQVARIANPNWIFAGETILLPPLNAPGC